MVRTGSSLPANTLFRVEDDDGLYTGGTYAGGTLSKSFVTSGTVTNVSF